MSISTRAAFMTAASIAAALSFASGLHAQSSSPTAKGANVKAGQVIFLQRCMQCHSVSQGEVRFGPSLYGELKPPQPKKTVAQARAIVANGKGKMTGYANVLRPVEIDSLILYMKTL